MDADSTPPEQDPKAHQGEPTPPPPPFAPDAELIGYLEREQKGAPSER